ncbi:DUF2184 domain-containing protein [Pseudomonas sp.]|uniref:DUF2184 domain-containing protein n=1 Tax=Pseudomonas sp. TaxID=306 RepID=UPI002587CAA3|nr:DUF2184 domain-containing protein [Pseudomonas sp.]
MTMFNPQQTLSFVEGQAYEVNRRVYETRYPDWDFSRLIYVDTSSPEWAPGVLTYSSDSSGRAEWQSGYAKDVPLADVTQAMQTRSFNLAAIGYQWNIEEVNTTMGFPGASLPDRRARAARLAYMKFMHDLVVKGDATKGMGGLINYPGVVATNAPAVGTSGSTLWVDENGVGQKTPQQIVNDINTVLMGVYLGTEEIELADTIGLPHEALTYINSTPMSALTDETIMSFVKRTNIYTQTTGRPLDVRGMRSLSRASADGATGRLIAYKNDAEYVKLHLPMPHRFLPVYQSGPLSFEVPGIFRTGGVEVLTTKAMRYLDKISQPPVGF